MRIWIVNQYAIPPSQAGGTRHHGLARALIRRGHQVTLIAGDFNYALRQPVRLDEGEAWRHEEMEGVPYVWIRIPSYAGNSVARVWSMLAFSQRVLAWVDDWPLRRPDLVIGSSPHLFAGLAAERLAKRFEVPFVLEVRDLWPASLVDVAGLSPGHPLVRGFELIERHLYRRAARIVTLLPGAADHMVEKGADRGKISWIPNGIDLALAPAPVPAPIQTPFVVTYAGGHGVANGLDSMFDAARILQDDGWGDRVRFRFIGDGPERERLKRRIAEEGLTSIVMDDPVPKERIFRELASASAFIMTLRDIELYRHGISANKLYDYMAMARPTIFGARAFNNPIEESGAGLIVPPEDALAMAKAVKALVEMAPRERWELGLRGRRFVEMHHDAGLLGGRLEAVLVSALGSSKVSTGRLKPAPVAASAAEPGGAPTPAGRG